MQSDTGEKVEYEDRKRNTYVSRKFFLRLPRAAFYLAFIGVLERFAYNGCKCLLTVYMLEYFTYDQYTIISIYHIFCGLASMFSRIFQMYCNSRTGKYRIVLLSSIVFAWYLQKTIPFPMKGRYSAPGNYDPHERIGQGFDTRISIFWQIPQYVMISFGEMLLLSTIMELFFRRFTEDTRSLGMALSHFAIGTGDFIVALAYCFGLDFTTVLLGFAMLQFSLPIIHGVLSVFDILE